MTDEIITQLARSVSSRSSAVVVALKGSHLTCGIADSWGWTVPRGGRAPEAVG